MLNKRKGATSLGFNYRLSAWRTLPLELSAQNVFCIIHWRKNIVRTCEICQKSFSGRAFGGHKAHCPPMQTKKCLICEKQISRSGFSCHVKAHDSDKNCKNCNNPITGRMIYCSQSCAATYANQKRKVQKFCVYCHLEITWTSSKKYKKKYCSSKCQQNFDHELYIKEWLSGDKSGNVSPEGTSIHVRKWLHNRAGNKCEECGWNKIHPLTKKVPLNIHHIDGNFLNTIPDNLKLLCGCCHSLTLNYGGLNRGNGRKLGKAISQNQTDSAVKL